MPSDEYPVVKRWNARLGRDEWVESEPDACPNGHPWPGNILRGWRACAEHGGHRTWRCTVCAVLMLNPPHDGEIPAEQWKIFG